MTNNKLQMPANFVALNENEKHSNAILILRGLAGLALLSPPSPSLCFD